MYLDVLVAPICSLSLLVLMLLWQDQGILARPSSETLVEWLYEKYISDYHHLQSPVVGPLVVQVRSIHQV